VINKSGSSNIDIWQETKSYNSNMENIKGKLLNNQSRNPTCQRKVYAIYIESQQKETKSKIESYTTTV